MKKLTAFILAGLLALPMAACGSDESITPPAATTTAPTVTTEAPETGIVQKNGSLTLLDAGESLFTVVRGTDAPKSELEAAQAFVRQTETIAGTRMTIATDEIGRGKEIDPSALEVLVGNTNRPESAELAASLPAMTFGIRTTDTKVIICAADAVNLTRAVDYFFAEFASVDTATGRLQVNSVVDYISEPYNYLAELLPTADTFTSTVEKLFTVPAPDDKSKNIQGGTIYGGYLYQAFIYKDTASNEANNISRIVKVDMATGKVVLTSGPLSLNHTNDITYNTKLNQLVVVHNNPNRTTVSLIDPETLKLTEVKKLPTNVYCIDYNTTRDAYTVGMSGGQSFTVLTGDLQLNKEYTRKPGIPTPRTNGYTTQGMTSDDNFHYFVLYKENVITVYDWDGKFVSLIEVDVGKVEPENISVVGNDLYITTTTSGGGATVWRVTPKAK